MESLPNEEGAGGAGSSTTFQGLQAADASWLKLRTMKTGRDAGPAPQVVTRLPGSWKDVPSLLKSTTTVFDVVVCGGTLGVFAAVALVMKGHKVAIIERGKLQGRKQDWNISRKELQELADMGVLTAAEIQAAISIEFNPSRCGFHEGGEIWVKDILNLGISPAKVVESAKQRFLAAGGVLYELTSLKSITVHDDGAIVSIKGRLPLVARLVIDAMGNFSPIVRQVRWGRKADGVCLVVGACARGFENNSASDIIYTATPMRRVNGELAQYFWEAFPAGSGPTDRTTYLFTYTDAHPKRPSLQQLLEEYWLLMPQYQGVDLEHLQFLRVLFGFFPTYRDSPLPAPFDRVMQVGDASGIQSPLSFGGFGSITRHLHRITTGVSEALEADTLTKGKLALINAYQVGLVALIDWLVHFVALAFYTLLSILVTPLLRPVVERSPPSLRYTGRRILESWQYGAGLDYKA
eukprot:SM000133S26811  [mRNA]  locus=s133:213044:217741:+ [translate_table: standard]